MICIDFGYVKKKEKCHYSVFSCVSSTNLFKSKLYNV